MPPWLILANKISYEINNQAVMVFTIGPIIPLRLNCKEVERRFNGINNLQRAFYRHKRSIIRLKVNYSNILTIKLQDFVRQIFKNTSFPAPFN